MLDGNALVGGLYSQVEILFSGVGHVFKSCIERDLMSVKKDAFLPTLADPADRTVIEYSDRSLTVLCPFSDLALLWLITIKKTFKALQ